MIRVLLFQLLFSLAFSGLITPDPNTPITAYRTNKGLSSLYVFEFILPNYISEPSQISIHFPQEFPTLKSSVCNGFVYSQLSKTSIPCTRDVNTITWSFSSLKAGPMSLGVENIQNPLKIQGTGYFKIYTLTNGIIQDSNELYPSIGIFDSPTSLNCFMQVDGSLMANYSPLLKFTITPDSSVKIGSWIRITLPEEFSISSNLKCYIEEIISYISCSEDNVDLFKIKTDSLPKLFSTITMKIYGIINPIHSGSTGSFLAEIMEKGTHTVQQISNQISGPYINPGVISSVQISGQPLHLSVEGTYNIAFKTHGDVSAGGIIKVSFPSEYQSVSYCKVLTGLTSLDSVKCTPSGNSISITQFDDFKAGLLTLEAVAINSKNPGTSSYFKISTLTSDGYIIDENNEAATITLSSISAPTEINAEMFKAKTTPQLGIYGPLEFYLQTRTELPATTNGKTGKIILYLPTDTQTPQDYTQLSCLFGKNQVPASSCLFNSGTPPTITMTTPSTEKFGCCPLAITVTTIGSPTETKFGFLATTGGEKSIKVEVYIDSGSGFVLTEEMNYNYFQAPRKLGSASDYSSLNNKGSASWDLLHYSVDYQNTIEISISNGLEIPIGGGIEVDFITSNFGFPNTLGTGLHSLESSSFQCVFDTSVWGADASCTITAGTPLIPAKVKLISKNVISADHASTSILFYWIKNNKFIGYKPKATVKTIDADGVALEYYDLEGTVSLKQNSSPCTSGGLNTVSSTTSTPEIDVDYIFTVHSEISMVPTDKLFIIIPNEFKILTSANIDICSNSGTALESKINYKFYISDSFKVIIFTNPGSSNIDSSSISPCITLKNRLYKGTTVFTVYQVSNSEVAYCSTFSIDNFTPTTFASVPLPSISEILTPTTDKIISNRVLLNFQFKTTQRITAGGTVSVSFPSDYLISETSCYKIDSPSNTKCYVKDDACSSPSICYRYVLSFVGELVAGTSFDFLGFVNTPSSHISTSITITSNDEDDTLNKLIEQTTVTWSYESAIDSPSSANLYSFVSPKIIARVGDKGPLIFNFKLPSGITLSKSDSASNYAKIVVTLPSGFSVPSSTILDCYIDDMISSWCKNSGRDIYIYTNRETDVSDSVMHKLTITTLDDTTADEVGIEYPTTNPGDYQFKITTSNLENDNGFANPWMHVQASGFTYISINSLQKYAGQWNFLEFNFMIGISLSGTKVVWLEFPSSQWDFDLGTGLENNSPIDCPFFSDSTEKGIACTLIHGYIDYVRIKITGLSTSSSQDTTVFHFYLGPIKNPSNSNYDMQIRVRAEEQDLTAPTFKTKAEELVSYIDTTFPFPSDITTTSSPDPTSDCFCDTSSTCINPDLYDTGLVMKINMKHGTKVLGATDYAVIKLPTDYTATSIVCKVEGDIQNYCFWFPIANYALVKLESISDNAQFVIKISGIIAPGYQYEITGLSMIIIDRKLEKIISYDFDDSNLLNTGVFTTASPDKVSISSYFDFFPNQPELYRITIKPIHRIPSTGQIKIKFGGLASGIEKDSIRLTPESTISPEGLKFVLTYSQNSPSSTIITIYGFSKEISNNDIISIFVNGQAPSARYTIYVSTYWESTNTDKLIDGDSDVDMNVATTLTDVKLLPTEFGTKGLMYHRAEPIRSTNKIGPLVLTISSASAIVKRVGYLTVVGTMTFQHSYGLRCIWKSNGVERLASDFIYSNPDSKTHFKIFAPADSDLPANTDLVLTITTVNRENYQGLQWDNIGEYQLDLGLDYDGDDAIDYVSTLYVEILPQEFSSITVIPGNFIPNSRNLLDISLKCDQVIPAGTGGGRIVIEFPTSFFANDLGSDYVDDSDVPCIAVSGITSGIKCSFQLGSNADNEPARIYVSPLSEISGGTAVRFFISKFMNPNKSTNLDSEIFSITIYAATMTTNLSGTKLCHSYANNLGYLFSYTTTINDARSSEIALGTLPVVGDVVVDAETTYTLTISKPLHQKPRSSPATSGWSAGDYLLIDLPGDTTFGSSSPVNCQDATTNSLCIVDKSARILIIQIVSTVPSNDLVITINKVENPSHAYDIADNPKLTIHYMQERILTEKLEISLPFNTLTTIDFDTSPEIVRYYETASRTTTYYGKDTFDMLITVTPDFDIPAGGAIVADFHTNNYLPENNCIAYYNNLEAYSCTISSDVLIYAPESGLQKSKKYKIIVAVTMAAKGTSSTSISVYTVWDKTKLSTTKSQTHSVSIKAVDQNCEAPIYFEIPRQYEFPIEASAGTYAPISFSYTPLSTISKSGGLLVLTLPSFPAIGSGSTLICIWSSKVDKSCKSETDSVNLIITTYAPDDFTAAIDFTFTTTNSNTFEQEGLELPTTTNGDHLVTIEIYVSYSGTNSDSYEEKGSLGINIAPDKKWKTLEVTPAHSSASIQNFFEIKISVAECSSLRVNVKKIRVYFPTKDRHGTTLFLNDLGTGTADGYNFPCDIDSSSILDTGTACTINHGASNQMYPAYIEVNPVYNSGTLSGSCTLTFYIDKIVNPAWTTDDRSHIHITVVGYSSTLVTYLQTYYDVFTVTNEVGTGPIDPTYFFPLITDATAKISFALNLPSSNNQDLYLCFPSTFDISSVVLDDPSKGSITKTHISSKVLKITTSGTDTLNFYLDSGKSYLDSQETNIIAYFLSSDNTKYFNFIITQYTYNYKVPSSKPEINLATSLLSIDPDLSDYNRGQIVNLTFTVTIPAVKLISTNCLIIATPELPIIDYCTNVYSSSNNVNIDNGGSWSCSKSNDGLKVVGFSSSTGTSNTIVVKSTYMPTDWTDGKITASLYIDQDCSAASFFYSFSINAITPNQAHDAPSYFNFETLELPSTTVKEGDKVQIEFYFIPTTDTVSYLILTPSFSFTDKDGDASIDCSITIAKTQYSASCTILGSDMKIIPSKQLTSSNKYKFIVKTHGAASRNDGFGLNSSGSGQKYIKVSVYEANDVEIQEGFYFYSPPASLFSSLSVEVMHITPGIENVFTITFKSINPSPTDIFIIQFPTINRDSSIELFLEDLGTGISNGDEIGCAGGGANAKCYIHYGDKDLYHPTEIHVTELVSTAPNAEVEYTLIIPGIVNPNPDSDYFDKGIVDIRVVRMSKTFVILEERTAKNVFAASGNAPTGSNQENWLVTAISFDKSYKDSNSFTFPIDFDGQDSILIKFGLNGFDYSSIVDSQGNKPTLFSKGSWVFITNPNGGTSLFKASGPLHSKIDDVDSLLIFSAKDRICSKKYTWTRTIDSTNNNINPTFLQYTADTVTSPDPSTYKSIKNYKKWIFSWNNQLMEDNNDIVASALGSLKKGTIKFYVADNTNGQYGGLDSDFLVFDVKERESTNYVTKNVVWYIDKANGIAYIFDADLTQSTDFAITLLVTNPATVINPKIMIEIYQDTECTKLFTQMKSQDNREIDSPGYTALSSTSAAVVGSAGTTIIDSTKLYIQFTSSQDFNEITVKTDIFSIPTTRATCSTPSPQVMKGATTIDSSKYTSSWDTTTSEATIFFSETCSSQQYTIDLFLPCQYYLNYIGYGFVTIFTSADGSLKEAYSWPVTFPGSTTITKYEDSLYINEASVLKFNFDIGDLTPATSDPKTLGMDIFFDTSDCDLYIEMAAGDTPPFKIQSHSDPTQNSNWACTVRNGNSDTRIAISCSLIGSPNGHDILDVYFPMIVPQKTPFSVKVDFINYGDYKYYYKSSNLDFTAKTPTSNSAKSSNFSPNPSFPGAESIWTFAFENLNYAQGNYILMAFEDLDSLASDSVDLLTDIIWFSNSPCPCIYGKFVSGPSNTISLKTTNPSTSSYPYTGYIYTNTDDFQSFAGTGTFSAQQLTAQMYSIENKNSQHPKVWPCEETQLAISGTFDGTITHIGALIVSFSTNILTISNSKSYILINDDRKYGVIMSQSATSSNPQRLYLQFALDINPSPSGKAFKAFLYVTIPSSASGADIDVHVSVYRSEPPSDPFSVMYSDATIPLLVETGKTYISSQNLLFPASLESPIKIAAISDYSPIAFKVQIENAISPGSIIRLTFDQSIIPDPSTCWAIFEDTSTADLYSAARVETDPSNDIVNIYTPLSTELSASRSYKVTFGTYGQNIGFQINSVPISAIILDIISPATASDSIYQALSVPLHIYKPFTKLNGKSFISDINESTFIEINFKVSQDIAEKSEILIGFPLVDDASNSLFGSTTSSNTNGNCYLTYASAAGTESEEICTFLKHSDHYADPQILYLKIFVKNAIAATTIATLWIADIINPVDLYSADIFVYVLGTNVEFGSVLKNFFTILAGSTPGTTLISSPNPLKVFETFSLEFSPDKSIDENTGAILFKFDPTDFSLSSSSKATVSNSLHSDQTGKCKMVPSNGWMLYIPQQTIANSPATIFDFSEIYYNHIGTTQGALGSAILNGIVISKYTFNSGDPDITPGEITLNSNQIDQFSFHNHPYTREVNFEFEIPHEIPSQGSISIAFPTGTTSTITDPSSIACKLTVENCATTINGNLLKCEPKDSNTKWLISGFGGCKASGTLTVQGRVTVADTSTITDDYTISTHKTSDGTIIIDQYKFVPPNNSQYEILSANDLYTSFFVMKSSLIPVRTDKGALTLIFKLAIAPSSTDIMSINVPSTSPYPFSLSSSNVRTVCKFIDTSGLEYSSKKCSFDSPNWNIAMPSNKVITRNEKWILTIYTTGELNNGLVFPTSGKPYITFSLADSSSAKWKVSEFVDIIGSSGLSKLTVTPLIANAESASIFKISLSLTNAISTQSYLIAEFPTFFNEIEYYDESLGMTSQTSLGCAYADSSGIVNQADCYLRFGQNKDSDYNYRPASVIIPFSSLSQAEIFIPQIKLYSSVGLTSYVRVKIITLDTDGWDQYEAEGVIWYALTTSDTQTATATSSTEKSYMFSITSKTTWASNSDFWLTVSIPNTLYGAEYVIFTFPYEIDESVTIDKCSANPLILKPLNTIVCKPATPISGTPYTWQFFSWANLNYNSQDNDVTATFILKQNIQLVTKFSDNNDAYAPDSFDSHETEIVAYNSVESSRGLMMRYKLTMKVNQIYAKDSYFKIYLPPGFTLGFRCELVITAALQLTNPSGFGSCVRGDDDYFIVSGFSYNKDTIDIIFTVINPTSSGGNTVTLSFCQEKTCTNSIMNSASLIITTTSTVALKKSSVVSPGLLDSKVPIRLNEYGDLQFSVKTDSVSIVQKTGYITIKTSDELIETLISPYTCRALWISSSTLQTYMSYDCTFTTNSGTPNQNEITIYAPETVDISPSETWSIIVTSINLENKGFKFSNTISSYRYKVVVYNVQYYYKTELFIAPAQSKGTIDYFVKANDAMNGFYITYQGTISDGIDPPTDSDGRSEIIVEFDSSVWSQNLGTHVSNTDYTDDWGATDCAGISSTCYLRRGHSSSNTNAELWIRKFDGTSGASIISKIIILPVTNPSSVEKIINIKMYAREWDTSQSDFKYGFYREFNYVYMTETALNPPTIQNSVSVSYDNTDISTSSITATFTIQGTSQIIEYSPSNGKIGAYVLKMNNNYFSLSDISGPVHSETYVFPIHSYIATFPLEEWDLTSTLTKAYTGVTTPDYGAPVSWIGWIWIDGQYEVSLTYSTFYLNRETTNTITTTLLKEGTDGPYSGRTDIYTINFTPIKPIPEGGSILISIPVQFTAFSSHCWVQSGLSGNWNCQSSSSPQEWSITGFSAYAPSSNPILISGTLTAATTLTSSSIAPFEVNIYGIAGDINTLIETNTKSPSLTILSAPQIFTSAIFNQQYKPQYPSRPGEYSGIIFDITPRTNPYSFHDKINLYLDSSATVLSISAAGNEHAQLQCIITDGTNYVRAETCTASTGSPNMIQIEIPEQMTIPDASSRQILISYRFADTNINNGIKLPSSITEAYGTSWYLKANLADFISSPQEYKFTKALYGAKPTSLSVTLGHKSQGEFTFIDIQMELSSDIQPDDVIRLSLPTFNGLDTLFAPDLGIGALTGKLVTLNCGEFHGSSYQAATCKFTVPDISSSYNPVDIEITGLAVSSDTSFTIRIANIKNPTQTTDTIFSQNLNCIAKITIVKKFFDYDLIEYEDDAVLYTSLSTASPTLIADSTATSSDQLTLSELTNGIVITFSSPSGAINSPGGSFILIMDSAFNLPAFEDNSVDGICNVPGNCKPLSFGSSQWIVTDIATSSAYNLDGETFTIKSNSGFISANYHQNSPYTLTLYVISNQVLIEIHTIKLDSFNPRAPTSAAITNQQGSTIPQSYYDIYTIDILPVFSSSPLKRVDVIFPTAFQFIDTNCKSYSGVTSIGTPPISCTSDCISTSCSSKHVILTNFNYDNQSHIKISIGAISPSVAGSAGNLIVRLYDSTDTSLFAQEDTSSSLGTVESHSSTYDFWVDWVETDLYSRKIRAGEIGDIYLRIKPHTDLPMGTTLYITFPSGFGPAGGTPYCVIGEGDLYYDNFPLFWSRNYTHPVSKSCLWKQGTLEILLQSEDTSEFSGFFENKCAFLQLTTTGQTVNGLRVPDTPGYYQLEAYAMYDNSLIEISLPSLYVSPSASFADLSISLTNLETNYPTVLKISFTTSQYIPPGYPNTVKNEAGPEGTIQINFEIFQSFSADLGYYSTGDSVPCAKIQGILPKEGESLKCIFTKGDSTLSRPSNSYITITNFQEIQQSTLIEIHFSKIKNGATDTYKPTVGVGIYQTYSDGTVVWIYDTSYQTLSAISTATQTSNSAQILSLSPNTVGATCIATLTFQIFTALSSGDLITITFPSVYPVPDSGLIVNIKKGSTAVISSLSYNSYSQTGVILIYLGQNSLAVDTYSIELKNMKNPASVFTCSGCYVNYYTVKSNNVIDVYTTSAISTNPGLTAQTASITALTLSDYSASAVYVQLSMTVDPAISIPKGGKIQIYMSTEFPSFGNSSPAPTCSSVYQCAVFDKIIQVSGFTSDYSDNIDINVIGMKNPSKTGATSTGSQGFKIYAYDSNNFLTIYSEPSNTVTISSEVSEASTQFTVNARFKAIGISDTYTFNVFIPVVLQTGTQIVLAFPDPYSLGSSISCSSDFLATCTAQNSKMTLTALETIALYSTVSIYLSNIINPTVSIDEGSNSKTVSPFYIKIYYDNVLIVGSNNTTMQIYQKPSNAIVTNRNYYPTNSGEHASYTFKITTGKNLTKSNSIGLIVKFPTEYADSLVPDDVKFVCDSSWTFSNCNLNGNKEVIFSILNYNITENKEITLSMYGIGNPSAGVTSFLEVLVIDQSLGVALSDSGNALMFNIESAADIVSLNSIDAEKSVANTLTSYTFSIDLSNKIVLTTDVVWIDWPTEISRIFTQTTCAADIIYSSKTYKLDCKLLAYTGYTRTEVSNLPSLQNPTTIVNLTVYNIPTPSSAGVTERFYLRFANSTQVKYRSFPMLTQIPSLSFSNSSYSISSPTKVSVLQGTYSDILSINLQLPSYTILSLTLSSAYSGLKLSPSKISMQYAWDMNKTFRVGALSSLNSGYYTLSWQLQADSTNSATYYTPKDIIVNVLSQSQTYKITIDDIGNLPINGTTVPINVELERPVADYLIVSLSAENSPSSFVFDPFNLAFNDGEYKKSFTITAKPGAVSTFINFKISGTSSPCFYLEKSKTGIVIASSSTDIPEILSAGMTKIGRVSAEIKVTLSQQGTVYYMLTHPGSVIPNATSIIKNTRVNNDDFQTFGSSFTSPLLISSKIVISDLIDNTNYMISFAAMGINGVASKTVKTLYFTTSASHKPAKFNIYTTSLSTPAQVIGAISSTLALPASLFYHTGIDPASYGIFNRRLTSILYYEITMVANRSLDMQAPLSYIQTLDNNLDLLKNHLPNLDTNYSVSSRAAEVVYKAPSFSSSPSLVYNSSDTYTFSLKLNSLGKIYVIGLPLGEAMPNSWQITNSFNSTNNKVDVYQEIEISSINTVNITFNATNVDYKFWFTGANNRPLDPDLMSDSKIKSIVCVAEKKRPTLVLITDAASELSIVLVTAALIFI